MRNSYSYKGFSPLIILKYDSFLLPLQEYFIE